MTAHHFVIDREQRPQLLVLLLVLIVMLGASLARAERARTLRQATASVTLDVADAARS